MRNARDPNRWKGRLVGWGLVVWLVASFFVLPVLIRELNFVLLLAYLLPMLAIMAERRTLKRALWIVLVLLFVF